MIPAAAHRPPHGGYPTPTPVLPSTLLLPNPVAADGPMVYRDFCNACGAARDNPHEPRCHLTGVVGAWSGITP